MYTQAANKKQEELGRLARQAQKSEAQLKQVRTYQGNMCLSLSLHMPAACVLANSASQFFVN